MKRTLAAVLAIAAVASRAGHAEEPAPSPVPLDDEPTPKAAAPVPLAPRVALSMSGNDFTDEKFNRCVGVLVSSGAVIDPAAPLRIELQLASDNRLRLVWSEGVVALDEPRPGDGVEALCGDALAKAIATLRQKTPGAVFAVHAPKLGLSSAKDNRDSGIVLSSLGFVAVVVLMIECGIGLCGPVRESGIQGMALGIPAVAGAVMFAVGIPLWVAGQAQLNRARKSTVRVSPAGLQLTF